MKKIALVNGLIIDGNGGEPIERGIVTVDGSTIGYVGRYDTDVLDRYRREGAVFYDVSGMAVIPGIIDCHVHFGGVTRSDPNEFVLEDTAKKSVMSVSQAQAMVSHGITTVRDISVNGFALKAAFDGGFIQGPRIVACGPGLSRTAGHGDAHLLPLGLVKAMHPWATIADTRDDIIRAVRGLIRMNSDCIKVWVSGGGFWEKESDDDTHYTGDDIALIVDEAKRIGLPVAAHAENFESAAIAAEAGVTSIEHGERLSDSCISMMKEKEIFLVPTLKLILDWENEYEPTVEKVTGNYGQEGQSSGLAVAESHRTTVESFSKAVDANLKICVGSDSFCESFTPYGPVTYGEIQSLASNGLGPMRAITAATKTGAELLGLSQSIGTLEAGKFADIAVFSKNPLDDISNIDKANLKLVIKNGETIVTHLEVI